MTALFLAAALALSADAPLDPLDPLDPLASFAEVQVTGWSANETRFSVRAFQRDEGGSEGDPKECKGYVDQNGKKFSGRLVVAAYDKGKLVESWLVQDYPSCTPPEKAKVTLAAAKEKFLELGIDLNAKGSQLSCDKPCDLKHGGATLIFEGAVKRLEDDNNARMKGLLRLWLKTGKDKTKLFEKTVDAPVTPGVGAVVSAGIRPVEVSPGGKALLVRLFTSVSTARGPTSSQIPVGLFMWNGGVLEAAAER